MKKFANLIFSLALSLAAFSCNRLQPDSVPEGMIAFSQEGLVDFFSATAQTKATEVTESTLNSSGFNVSCTTGSAGSESNVWNNVAFSKSGSYFVAGGGGKWWPDANPSYHFFASNAALTFNAGGCTVAATNATDVVCAYMPSPTYKSRNTLQFKHIFARITDVTFSAADGYTISGISVTVTPKTGGTYNLRTGSGQTDGTGWSSLTTGSATAIANSTPGTKSNNLYLVPGRYVLTASWTATKGDYTKTFSNKTYEVNVVGGKCNVITASLVGDASAIEFAVSVTPWSSAPTIERVAADFEDPARLPLPGEFSVSSTKRVKFSKGNLQAVIGSGPTDTYNYTASSWKFAEHQYNIIGNTAGNNSFAVGTMVDLFGWVGASATWNTYGLCTNTTSSYNPYYGINQDEELKTDWGSISGVVSACGSGWYSLSTFEWLYLFSQRVGSSSKYGQCQIETESGIVTGMLLIPDSWSKPSNCTVKTGNGAFNRVTYSATAASGATNAWCDMEAAGAVFLPAAGYRQGLSTGRVGEYGYYWSSPSVAEDAFCIYFSSGSRSIQNYSTRFIGYSVRLVKDA